MDSEEHQVVAIQNLQKFRRVVAHQELCKNTIHRYSDLDRVVMILPQVHLRKPCYDFTFL